MRKYYILALIFMLGISINAQQLPVASYYMYDYSRTNPGSLGSKDMLCANIIRKDAFNGLPGWPQTTLLDFEVPFKLFGGKHGVGMNIYQDKIGFNTDTEFNLGYAFRFNVADGTLGIGIKGGFIQRGLKGTWVGLPGDSPENDPNIPPSSSENIMAASFSGGVFYRSEDIYLGASVLNVYAQKFDYSKKVASSTTKITLTPHYYATAGYKLQMSNSAYELKPSVMLYSDGRTATLDLNGTLEYNKRIWGGVSYRVSSAVIGMVGLMIFDGAKIGYAYDFQTSALSSQSSGSHEFILNYCVKLGNEKQPERYKSIRYL